MLRIEQIYWLIGLLFLAGAWQSWRNGGPRRAAAALFWLILASAFLGGDYIQAQASAGDLLPAQLLGGGMIVLALLAGFGGLRHSEPPDRDAALRAASAQRFGNRLFLPALLMPVLTVVLVLLGPRLSIGSLVLFDARQVTLLAFGIACVLALVAALLLTRTRPSQALVQGSRLLHTLSWAAMLPMLLAALGMVFTSAGVGDAVAALVAQVIPTDSRLACVLAYGLGMVLFTVIMGNAFAAFPVMTAGIGLPLLIVQQHANPAVVGAIGMLSGYCGTLLTPMAANYNVVPAMLLQLKDRNGVIRAQAPTALVLLLVNLALMYLLAFR